MPYALIKAWILCFLHILYKILGLTLFLLMEDFFIIFGTITNTSKRILSIEMSTFKPDQTGRAMKMKLKGIIKSES